MNSDASKADGFSPVFAIDKNGSGVAKDNMTIDAGYFEPAQLGNYVWNDLDKDGVQDGNEVGVAGITVTLCNSLNNTISSTITDAYGYYKFQPLNPDIYKVKFTLPANYQFTAKDAAGNDETDSDVDPGLGVTDNVVVVSGDSNMTVDAGIYFVQPSTAKVGNFVWYDLNKDGIQNVGETGISGVTVTLYNLAGDIVATTITDADGFYCFTDVIPVPIV
ncbi:MAG: carboxypeptidase regulatory-like domain-containing protein [Bacteroidetes bacterium]|nr:carboxypeptidase regulatory-like domain-containing protein [Bacteroidota bacterium]